MKLTPTQEDYIEVISHLSTELPVVRVTDIANMLGCRLPTVSRTIIHLKRLGLVKKEKGKYIVLSPLGQTIAKEIVHRHHDIVEFLSRILGVKSLEAHAIACKIEHGFSGSAANRLHAFMLYFESLARIDQKRISLSVDYIADTCSEFNIIQSGQHIGARI